MTLPIPFSNPGKIRPSAFYPSYFSILVEVDITKSSDTLIMKPGEISRISNTTIFDTVKTTKLSDAAIFVEGFGDKEVLSDVVILKTTKTTVDSIVRIQNTFEKSPTSVTAIFRSHYGNKEKLSDARVVLEGVSVISHSSDTIIKGTNKFTKLSDSFIVLGQKTTKLSDSTIYRSPYETKEILSDSAIHIDGYQTMDVSSDSIIFKGGIKTTKLSDTRILRIGGLYPSQTKKKNSNVRILNPSTISKNSLTRIEGGDKIVSLLSDTLIILNPIISVISDTFIELSNTLSISSFSKILSIQKDTKLSDSVIKIFDNKLTKLSDTVIYRNPKELVLSDSRILKSFEILHSSDTLIKDIVTINRLSDSTIFRSDYGLIKLTSWSTIERENFSKKTKISDSRIKKTFTINKTSDTAMRRDRGTLEVLFNKTR